MDIRATRAAAAEITGRVRAGGGPEFVEAITYRFVGHSRSDPGKYRPEGELDRWRERDPLVVARSGLGLDARRASSAIEAEVEPRSSIAIEARGLAAPFPERVSHPGVQ